MGEQTTTAVDQVPVTLAGAVKILRTYGFGATADLAEAKAASVAQLPTVVVAGEVKRGKSSLVNAMIGAKVSPYDVDVTTSAALAFVAPTHERPSGCVDLVYPGAVRRIPVAELGDWVTVSGRRVLDPSTAALPTRAIVPVPSPFLDNLVLVDTPGTGGLSSVHSRLSVQSAQTATVLVLVCDASAPLTAPEMAFIGDAASTTETVIVVVTKTDKNIRRWKAIVDENQSLIRTHLRRTIPVIGVSSLRASAAATLPVAQRDDAERSSGISALRELIDSGVRAHERLGGVDGLRTALEGLRKVHAKIAADIAVTRDSAGAIPELTAQRDRLAELKDQSAQWEQYLGRDLTLARQAAIAFLEERLESVKTSWTARINSNGMAVLRQNPQVFTADIEADLLAAMTATVENFLDSLRSIVLPLFESDVVWRQIETSLMASIRTDTLATGEVGSKRQGLLDPSVLTMGMIGTSMLGALIGVGAVAGVVWVGVNLGYKAMRAGKSNLLTWLRETVGTAKSSTARILEATLAQARPDIVVHRRDYLRTAMDDVQKQMADAKESARLDAAERDATLKRLNTNQRVVMAKISEIDNLIAKLAVSQGSAQ